MAILMTALPVGAVGPIPGTFADCPGGNLKVNAASEHDPNGEYCLIWNRGNFGDGNGRFEIADPSIIKIDDDYYVTGTTDDGGFYHTANLPIYRSRDLVNWQPAGEVFSDALRADDRIAINEYGTEDRLFCNIWAPHWYIQPDSPDTIWLSFTATEHRGHPDLPDGGYCDDQFDNLKAEHRNSVMAVSSSIDNFSSGGHFADEESAEPRWFAYSLEATPDPGEWLYDGGEGLGQAPAIRTVPTTGSPDFRKDGQNPAGTVIRFGFSRRYCHERDELGPIDLDAIWKHCSTWMALDTFSFYDPNTLRRWVLYTWMVDGLAGSPNWTGNHVAAHPLDVDHDYDTFGPHVVLETEPDPDNSEHLPLAFRRNTSNQVDGIDNGCLNRDGVEVPACVAEGPAVFYNEANGYYYLLYSRNGFGSPAYGIFYRFASTFKDLALKDGLGANSWNDSIVPEYPLVTALDRSVPGGPSYGHGEIFIGPGDQPYLIFHAKDPVTHLRTVYFKDLTFDADGTILPLTESPFDERGVRDRRRDLRHFLIPRPTTNVNPGLVLSEVLYDAVGADAGLEWVEIYNPGTVAVDLSGYSLGYGGGSYTYGILQLSGSVAAQGVFVVGGPTSGTANGNPSFHQAVDFSPDLQNSGLDADGVALFNVPAAMVTSTTVPIDAVVYGPSNNNGLVDETGTVSAPDVGDAPSGASIVRTDLAGSWQIASAPSPNTSGL